MGCIMNRAPDYVLESINLALQELVADEDQEYVQRMLVQEEAGYFGVIGMLCYCESNNNRFEAGLERIARQYYNSILVPGDKHLRPLRPDSFIGQLIELLK